MTTCETVAHESDERVSSLGIRVSYTRERERERTDLNDDSQERENDELSDE